MKKAVSFLLVLVLCLSLLSMAAFAIELDKATETASGVFSTVKAFNSVFGLPPVFTQLFDLVKGNKLHDILSTVLGILDLFAAN